MRSAARAAISEARSALGAVSITKKSGPVLPGGLGQEGESFCVVAHDFRLVTALVGPFARGRLWVEIDDCRAVAIELGADGEVNRESGFPCNRPFERLLRLSSCRHAGSLTCPHAARPTTRITRGDGCRISPPTRVLFGFQRHEQAPSGPCRWKNPDSGVDGAD